MGTKVGVGESKQADPFMAGVEAARTALSNAGINTCDFVLLFATADYDHNKLLKGVRSVTGEAPLSGCSASGVITQTGPSGEGYYTESGLVKGESTAALMVFSSEKIRFQNFIAHDLKENSKKAGGEIAKKIHSQPDPPLLLVMFPDGLTVNSSALFSGIESNIKEPVLFSGGCASESLNAFKTYQFYNDQVFSDSVSCIMISGEAAIETAISHGCTPIGTEKTVTRAEANRIIEINNESAWAFFKTYLPENATDLTAELAGTLCLCERLPKQLATNYDTHIVRAPALKNPDGSIQVLAEIPTGSNIQLGRRDPDKISLNAKKMAERIRSNPGDRKPVAVLHFDCAARGKLCFGSEAKEKGIDVIQDVFDKNIPWLGFYAYGEIGPIGRKNFFHNFTASLCVIY
ncbi:MAG: FIST C-terminal domain-containing protein [Bacteroidales bacterium]|nr:FIST C-terminal domain-containing protein [Bacteroidales bacterium]